MDEKKINELIQQLTQNLQNVESARKQVEKTVSAYDALKGDVRKYTEELSFITQNTRTLISQLDGVKKHFLDNISAGIIEKIEESVTELKTTIGGVSTQIGTVESTLKAKSGEISDNIKSRADFIDDKQKEIKELLDSIKSQQDIIATTTNNILESLNTLNTNESNHYKKIIEQIENQTQSVKEEIWAGQKLNQRYFVVGIILMLVIVAILVYTITV